MPQTSWSPGTTQQLRKLVAAPYLVPNDWTPRSEAYFVFPLAQGTPGKQCGLAATGGYQPSLRSPWLAADVLVVWRLDRLGRSLKDLVEIVSALEDRGVGFQSLTENIDTVSAGGKLVFHIFGALAEFEHSLIRERTMAGLAAARARGRKGGRKPSMSKADVRKAAAMLKDPQMTKTEVAQHFGVSRVTLNNSLKRNGYPLNPVALDTATTREGTT
ncbi:recombinase family protein [Thiolapillus sp.]|uniref:recombinase family protein n=5 Tax=Thiolapillus sp. TaxID=2017437 RepID=UPI003AF7B7F0